MMTEISCWERQSMTGSCNWGWWRRRVRGVLWGFCCAAGVLLSQQAATGKPRLPSPPWPELGLVGHVTFDEPLYWPANQSIDPTVYAESWSGYSLRREGSYASPYAVPMLASNGAFEMDRQRGAVRLWFKPEWSSLNTGLGAGPGGVARLLTLAATNGASSAVFWSLAFARDGNSLQLQCQTEGAAAVCLSAAVSLQAGNWYLFTLGYTESNTVLCVNDQLAASGGGLLAVPAEAVPYTSLFLGSSVSGFELASGEIEEVCVFSGNKHFYRDMNNGFGLSESWEIAGYYNAFSATAALGPISDAALAVVASSRSDAVIAAAAMATSASLLSVDSAEADLVLVSDAQSGCVTGGPVYITNFVAAQDSASSWSVTFQAAGGTNGLMYDVFGSSQLGGSLTNAPWMWLGRTAACGTFSLGGQITNLLVILGTPRDSSGQGITDAYCQLILKSRPPLGYIPSSDGYGTPDAWYLAHGLNPLTPGIGSLDSDGDGVLNYQEYRQATDPCSADGFAVWLANPSGSAAIP